jgi:hypothetical protein
MQTSIIVSYDAGWGNNLTLRGTPPLSWDSGTPMLSVDSQTWRLDLDLSEPLDFKPKLNDTLWAFGRKDYRIEPGQTVQLYPHFRQTPGWSDVIGYIPFKGRDITVRLYRPPGYQENAQKRYPVMYALDGQSLFEGQHGGWRMDSYLNALLESRVADPLLLVGIDFLEPGAVTNPADASRVAEFGDFVLKLKESVDRNYPTRPEPEFQGVLGFAQSVPLAWWLHQQQGHTFSRPSLVVPSADWPEPVLSRDATVGGKVHLCATAQDDSWGPLASSLREAGLREDESLLCRQLEPNGDPTSWAARLGSPLRSLFPWSGR